jgi:phage tail sheath protein FI
MTAYKTPGVYIEEIVKFPPSVAQVETAIPAFIGYTEKATKKEQGDLNGIPKRITSMLEYRTYFGSAKKETAISVSVIDDVISATPPGDAQKSPFLMYYSLQMYFANGGGPCYIVSVGQYDSTLTSPATLVEFSKLKEGLTKIRKVDEPTLLLFPDATSLTGDGDFYAIYSDALTQCNELQDRFTIIDTYSDMEHNTSLSDSSGTPYGTLEPDKSIREGISLGKDYLKYGAVYFPFLETILDYVYDESQIDVVQQTSNPEDVQQKVKNVSDGIDSSVFDSTEFDALKTAVSAAADADAAVAIIPGIKDKINEFKTLISNLVSELNATLPIGRNNGATAEANALDTWITTVLEQAHLDFSKSIDDLNADDTATKINNEIDKDKAALDTLKTQVDTLIASGELKALIDALPGSGTTSTTVKLSTLQSDNNQLYNKIKAEIALLPVKLPPGSTIAGIYARVDSDRGVWKAPANVGVSYVTKPSVAVSHEDQMQLNVDEVAGKSINAIRTFTGKGILVWGARTLAGNDNEWRYVPVRRFFNMAEESIKKATEQFVFEPNDKNTWVRVKAMIDNFLTAQWRAGALAGPTPDKAFYVKVGLGETMTAIDILEGNMIIEIGMAVVRPAEFIILKFSHKMQEV